MICFSHDKMIPQSEQNNFWSHSLFLFAYPHELESMVQPTDAYFRILAWEIGLHEMFWDALREGGIVVHSTLGRGVITQQDIKPVKHDGYVAKLIHVKFDCGQSCVFHSRIEQNEKILESLAEEVTRALQ
ncbi:MAG TPA: hypothetical protein VGL94_21335 [Ktedonobacteraceae bacterium]|jgi:hypothetical protein